MRWERSSWARGSSTGRGTWRPIGSACRRGKGRRSRSDGRSDRVDWPSWMDFGKKSTAQKILSDAFGLINERTGSDPIELFETAVKNVTPLVEVRARRVGGATYQVPMEVRQERGIAMALRWLGKHRFRKPRRAVHQGSSEEDSFGITRILDRSR